MPRLRQRRGARRPRVFVLGLDGTPGSYLRAETTAGRLPNLAALFADGGPVPLRSSLPSVSSTAWTTFFTGRDPGGHGVFGFMDWAASHDLWFPNLEHVTVPTLWDVLGSAGRRSVILNVPGTYPARPLDGVLVSGFVAPRIERAVHPPALLPASGPWATASTSTPGPPGPSSRRSARTCSAPSTGAWRPSGCCSPRSHGTCTWPSSPRPTGSTTSCGTPWPPARSGPLTCSSTSTPPSTGSSAGWWTACPTGPSWSSSPTTGSRPSAEACTPTPGCASAASSPSTSTSPRALA